MKADQASRLRQYLDRFARWFFNVSPTEQIDAALTRPAVACVKRRAKRRRQQHPAPTRRVIRER
jgi:hypothetical protein